MRQFKSWRLCFGGVMLDRELFQFSFKAVQVNTHIQTQKKYAYWLYSQSTYVYAYTHKKESVSYLHKECKIHITCAKLSS